jgi:hypothetical protein
MQIDLRKIPTFYINMDHHKDRNIDMVQLGKDVGFEQYSRFNGVAMPKQPMAGCAKSHYGILENMKEPTIILEDDCVLQNSSYILEIPDDTDALYLGLSGWGFLNSQSKLNNLSYDRNEKFPGIYKINGMLATHAILYISPEYISLAKKIAKWSGDNNQHIDQGFALVQKYFNVYALKKPIFYQHSNTEATNIILRGKNG